MYENVVPRKDLIWKLRIPLKNKIFLWYLKKGVIFTKDKEIGRAALSVVFVTTMKRYNISSLIVMWLDLFGVPFL